MGQEQMPVVCSTGGKHWTWKRQKLCMLILQPLS